MTVYYCKNYRISVILDTNKKKLHMGFLGIGKPYFMKSTIELYREQLESLLESKCEVFRVPSINKKLPPIFVLIFRDYPSHNHFTIFTYGISFAVASKELILQLKSNDINWAHALGFLANHLREKCPFNIGQTIAFGQEISTGSKMKNFLVHEQEIFEESDIVINKKSTVNLLALTPIHEQEENSIKKLGWKKFLQKIETEKWNEKRNPVE